MATGVFNTARTGHNLRSRKRSPDQRPLDRFAELLAKHDTDAGDTGGNVATAARKMGMTITQGHSMLQRLRKELRDNGGKPE